METLLIALSVVVSLLAVVVFSPVMISVDSRRRQVRVRWLFALEFQAPLPGTAGQKCLTIFRRPFPIREPQPRTETSGEKRGKPAKAAADVQESRRKRRVLARFCLRCLGDSEIRRALARQLSMLLRRAFRSANLTRSDVDLSTPDPALNGMLAGALAATNMTRRLQMRVNFRGENSLFLELRFHPHRVLEAFLIFLAGLPHRAIFRQWRSFAAAQRH